MAEGEWQNHLEIEGDGLLRISRHGSMKVDAMIVSDSAHLAKSSDDRSISQLVNIASMPGVVGEAWAMADWHFGYGFPIGGVLGTDVEWGEEGGSISPGGVGFDINCGVRLMALDCSVDDIPNIDRLAGRLNGRIPSGGSGKGGLDISRQDLNEIISRGSDAMVDLGFAHQDDLKKIESNGVLETDEGVSERAMARGLKALGTLGSGNHFLELQTVQSIEEGNPHNLFEGQVMCMIHSGSRGLGHQVCTDHVRALEDKYRSRDGIWHSEEWGFEIQDRQLAAAPIHSKDGQSYLDAMNGAANFAFANRSALTHRLRQALAAEFEVETKLLYDVSHNIAKIEDHEINGTAKEPRLRGVIGELIKVGRKLLRKAPPQGLPAASKMVARRSLVSQGRTTPAFDEPYPVHQHCCNRYHSHRNKNRLPGHFNHQTAPYLSWDASPALCQIGIPARFPGNSRAEQNSVVLDNYGTNVLILQPRRWR